MVAVEGTQVFTLTLGFSTINPSFFFNPSINLNPNPNLGFLP